MFLMAFFSFFSQGKLEEEAGGGYRGKATGGGPGGGTPAEEAQGRDDQAGERQTLRADGQDEAPQKQPALRRSHRGRLWTLFKIYVRYA